MFQKYFLGLVAALACVCCFAADDGESIRIAKAGKALTPISISGYSGEAAQVIHFDLEVAGFEVVAADSAPYNLVGRNEGSQVEGRLTDRLSKKSLLAKAYTGGSTRTQAHALADEIVEIILKVKGIARTKIFYKQDVGRVGEIFMSDYDGHNPVQVTRDNAIVAAPAFVPGKWKVYYTSYKSGFPDIYAHDLGSGERRIVAAYPGLNTSAAISSDGSQIAMILSKAGSPDLYVASADGTGLRQLTKTKEDESSPCWAPDGSKICFASRVNERRSLYVVPSTGGSMLRVRTEGTPNPSEPDWSPDGKWIAYTSQTGAGFAICIVPAEGGIGEPLAAGEDPSWAPNSRTIVFTRRVGNKRILSLLDVPTKHVKDTAQISGSRSQPCWAR